ncbi:MAG: hypothetical protein IID46_13510 [Planctomycetes bacterium]|nr:hypothetical protein [Planctomycetota bacterium]
MQPWPTISPYQGPAYSQLHNNNGLWEYNFNSNGRRYTGSVEYLRSRTRKPNGIVGHPGAQRYKDFALPLLSTTFGETTVADRFQGDAPSPLFLGGVGFFPAIGQSGFNYYDRVDAGRSLGYPKSNGLRIRWGFMESDDTGFVIDGWWTGEGVSEFDAQNQAPRRSLSQPDALFQLIDSFTAVTILGAIDPSVISPQSGDQVLLSNLLNLRGLPVNDGTLRQLSDGSYVGGTTIPYDLEFKLKYKTESAGTSVNMLMVPIVKKRHIKVRPLLGVRYIYLKEQFGFRGTDSGLAYDNSNNSAGIFPQIKLHSVPNGIDENLDGVIDNAIDPEDQVVGGGGQQAGTPSVGRVIRLDLLAQILGVEHPGRYSAFIDNAAVSHLIGPEIGLQYDIGGKRIKLRGHTKFALLANFEKMNLKGNNIGEANNIGTNINVTNPLLPTFTSVQDSPLISPTQSNPNPNAFRDDVDQSHISPLFEQSLFLDLPVFEHIPYLKRVSALDKAKLTLGWTFTFIAEVARPSESIIYNANPRQGLFPTLDIKRGNWWTSNWSVGVEIPY